MNWLVKEEPSHYAFGALVKDGRTSWTGVRNPLAQKHLRSMKKGDRVFYYHTGDEKQIVGTATVLTEPYPDPADRSGKLWAVDVGPGAPLKKPVTLAAVKADPRFADFPLVRMPRLSVMPVPDPLWTALLDLAG
jgi:predicted RNA-binding protein with PUA-like domain